jgi:hypothetical protein
LLTPSSRFAGSSSRAHSGLPNGGHDKRSMKQML